MAKVVNDPKNLPVTIIVSDIDRFETNGIPEDFLKTIVKLPINKIGKETDKYFILSTTALLRFRFQKHLTPFRILRALMDACWIRNIHYIMIKKK